MLEKQHQPIAYELAQGLKLRNKQILYLCSSDKEARLLKNELLLFFDRSAIGYYLDREILPYDRFSTADSIIQERIQLLNSNKSTYKVIVTSSINLFEKLPPKDFFSARKKFKTGDLLSIKDLTSNLEALNYKRTDKVNSINQYTVRGGVVDFYSGFQSQPVRVDFFDDQKNYLKSKILNQGDVVLLAAGGHGFQMLESSEIIEVKQGPYAGEKDKIRLVVQTAKVKYGVSQINTTENGDLLVSGHGDGQIILWDVSSSEFIRVFSEKHKGPIKNLCINDSSLQIVSSDNSETIFL